MKSKSRIVILALFSLILGACRRQPLATQPPTVTPLMGKLTFAGSTTLQPLVAKIGDAFQKANPQVTLDIAAGGSVVGIQAVHDGSVDIGMASRALTEAEAEGITQYQIATDVIAIVVHPDNPVQNLTLEQLRGIYMGDITNWQEVGGPDQPIVPVAREKSSGTRGAFDELVLEKQEPAAANLRTAVTAGDVAALVSKDASAIGYLGFGNMEPSVKAIQINGVAPSEAAAAQKTYPLTRPLILLTGPLSQPLANEFIAFALSAEGQKLVEEFGWVPVK